MRPATPRRLLPLLLALVSPAAVIPVAVVTGASGDATSDPEPRRVAGEDRYETAAALATDGWDATDTVVVASGEDFPDALAAGALAAAHDAPLLLSRRDELPAPTAATIRDLGAEEAVLVGGRAALTASVRTDVAEIVDDVARVAGPTREATAAQVARAVAAAPHSGGTVGDDPVHDVEDVLVASGDDFPDALAAGGLLAQGRPVLLTRGERLATEVADVLGDLDPDRVTVLGGEAVVSERVVDDLTDLAGEVTRLSGADRYATSVAVLDRITEERDGDAVPLVVANGSAFPDGLAAGPYAARHDAAIVLTPPGRLADAVDRAVRDADLRASVTVVGGETALAGFVSDELAAAGAGETRPEPATEVRELTDAERERMHGTTWEPGCPVGLDDLVMLTVPHRDFSGQLAWGEMVVARDVAGEVAEILDELLAAEFPIARIEPMAAFAGDDDASMAANNSSAFNCRPITGGSRWSEHSYGTAIDLNPVHNPYRRGEAVLPPAGADYLDRGDVRPGMIVEGDAVTAAFDARGWQWGGRWQSLDDWMHFEVPR